MVFPRSPAVFAIAASAAVTGCLEEIEQPGDMLAMCEVQEDCDTGAGEVCDQGVCWGNPPATTTFAAVLVPPDDRPDLATTEIAALDVETDGTVFGLEFDAAVEIKGRVVLACDGVDTEVCGEDSSIPARIQVTRPSLIPGGPRFSRTITARGGVAAGDAAFTLRLPPVGPDEPPYEVTIRPTDPEVEIYEERTIEAAAPPRRLTLAADGNESDVTWVVGDPAEHRELTGQVVDAAGRGIPDQRVYVVGRWPGASDPERISTTATTDERGVFVVRVPVELEGTVDIVARPPSDEVSPRLRVEGLELPEPEPVEGAGGLEPIDLAELVMPSYPSPTRFALPIDGADSGGGKRPVPGAKVTLETTLASEDGTVATFSATATTDDEGIAELDLIPAGEENRPYEARITTPSSSVHASTHALEIAVGPGSRESTSFLASVTLPRRILVDGQIFDSTGLPVEGAQVEARVSPALSWKLGPAGRALASEHQVPTVTSDEAGSFVLWLDPVVADRAAIYDLSVVPPARVRAPRWSIERLHLDREGSTYALGGIELPPASHARGVVSADGEAVPGAEVWLYELGSDLELCDEAHAPGGDDCAPPARLRGLWRTGDDGSIWLVLPNPDDR